MRRLVSCLLAVAAVLSPAGSGARADLRPPEDGRLMAPEKVARHVWVMRQPDRLWSAVIGNVEIIEQSDGIVLVDSGGTIADGREIVAAVASLTPKPIKAVIITHWHNDHPLGIPAVLEKFPKARIISTEWTARLMSQQDVLETGIGKPDEALYKKRLDGATERSDEYRKQSLDPSLPAAERREFAIEAAWVMARARRQKDNFVVIPSETFGDKLIIDDPVTPVEALYLGRGNTRGDAQVWLPTQKVLIAGDLVVLPTPYGFSIPVEPILATLSRMEKYDFKILLPGHGRVQHDRSYLATLRWSMQDIRDQAQALAKSQVNAEEASKRFDRAEQRRRFGAKEAWSRRWLDAYWLDGMFATAFKQASGRPLEPGIDGGE